tara:strand:+ start:141 stop:407 length:267 start_codon:yes stop_codon:yes gene_type:complete
MTNISTIHYRNWTIITDYDSQKITWVQKDLHISKTEMIGNSINDHNFYNWKIHKILQEISQIEKKRAKKISKELEKIANQKSTDAINN